MMTTKKRIETDMGERVTRFIKDFTGRGPLETRVYILDDMVIVRMKDVLTPAEQQLACQIDCKKCWDMIKQMRNLLIEQGRSQLEDIIMDFLHIGVVSLHNDVSTKTGESVILFTLKQKPVFETPECWREQGGK